MKHPGMINKVYNVSEEIFNWSEDSFKRASEIIKKYPDSSQQSAVIPLLDLAQRQNSGWLSKTAIEKVAETLSMSCLLYTSPSPRDATLSRMPSSA